jgi:hypothetical protein
MCVARPIGRLGQRMKIAGIRSVVVSADMRDWVFVKVEADQDRSRTDDFTPRLVGQDPTRVGRVSQTMRCRPVWRVGVVGMSAMSGMGQALRDTLAKHKHSPVVELRGGSGTRPGAQVQAPWRQAEGSGARHAVQGRQHPPVFEAARGIVDERATAKHPFKQEATHSLTPPAWDGAILDWQWRYALTMSATSITYTCRSPSCVESKQIFVPSRLHRGCRSQRISPPISGIV